MSVEAISPPPPGSEMLVRKGVTPKEWEVTADETHFMELIDGRLLIHSLPGLLHQELLGFLQCYLGIHVERNGLGEVLQGPFTMQLGLERKLQPDLIFMTSRTVARLTHDRLIGPADLAIEIASPGTRGYDRGEKRECYRVGGVGEYWMIDPISKTVSLDRPAGYPVGVYAEGWVTSQACAGFALRAEWLWQEPLPQVAECLSQLHQRAV